MYDNAQSSTQVARPHGDHSGRRHGRGDSMPVSRPCVPLLYHELRPEPAAYSYVLSCSRFREHLELLSSLPANAFTPVLTFDDGHLSNYLYAMPALAEFGMCAHFFITAGWTGQRPDYMEPKHLRALHEAGHQIGAHGWTHTLLTQCTPSQLRHELADARQALEDHISAPVTTLSLPGGRSNSAVLDACRQAGYETVWTSVPGAVPSLQAPVVGRFNVLAGHSDAYLQKLLDPESGELKRAERVSRLKGAAQRALGDTLYAKLWALVNRQETEPSGSGTPAAASPSEGAAE